MHGLRISKKFGGLNQKLKCAARIDKLGLRTLYLI